MTLKIVLTLILIGCIHGFIFLRPPMHISTKQNLFGFGKSSKPVDKTNNGFDPGMLGDLPQNFSDMLKKAKEASQGLEQAKNDLSQTIHTGMDRTQQVMATFNGIGMPVEIKVSDSILAQGADAVSRATTEAIINAYELCQKAAVEQVSSLFGGGKFPF